MQIRDVDFVEVGEPDASHARGGEVHRRRTSQSTGADDEDRGGLEALLALFADFGKDEMARVALAFGLGEHHGSKRETIS
jgi:hypothetical protein